jgi:hypothetical protein
MPPGRVLAHNHIVHGTDWPSGINGFRFWTWPSRSKPRHFVLCPCGWSGLRHFARSGFVEDYRANPARYRRLVRRQEREWIVNGELTEHGCFGRAQGALF